ncbi:geranylgeranyl pyrophosphate synthase [Paucilactobacillus hokkaidonensis JCM 18461]|uniref:Geranylgeranyl pyrophosphate synthase n=2 Tax=Paucilactobacillus hokkaidonensis TaxID=1193095 RepID=A0A0A1GVY5_9LACO|nr:polyprenyl synthetase family protein [Paucilactobacillus hokkaidonensis]KRO11280.1 trans-hexaprenyltranstransferase [Paucilactobacillus hokkaidonensis]BAP85169.1 geranylgeranyl pyrophosphate synthase [Paucilactobacillus hokkaidonensis JCM 18461]
MAHKIWQNFPTVAVKLDDLKNYMFSLVSLTNKPIQTKILELIGAGGKLLRPGYFYLFSSLGPKQDLVKLQAGAAALELLHVATLIHDDVIDESPLRRNITTIHTMYGQRNAIYAGDFLFTLYFKQVIKSAYVMDDVSANANIMHAILDGELNQMQLNYNQKTTVTQYLAEIEGKTAKLFELACSQGARLSGCDQVIIDHAQQIGKKIGLAYQIQDDILDYTGQKKHTLKPTLEDVRQGVYSLPLILALETNRAALKSLLNKKGKMTNDEVKQVQQIVVNVGGVKRAFALADQYTSESLELIKELPDVPAREALIELTQNLLHRQQ